MKNFYAVLFLVLTSLSWAAENPAPPPSKLAEKLELGIALEVMIPNFLPDFEQIVPVFGPVLAVGLGEDQINLQAVYGSEKGISLFSAETDYRFNFHTPFFKCFALIGAAYFHYGANQNDHSLFAPLAGFGFSFRMARDFTMAVGTRVYRATDTIMSFGGHFSYVL